ncbi:lysozyme inhibitor LprI family protein [Rubritalea tangerina]|uniref:Lysozyme inhibitor LprI family protein n=1 Tax=Rubritalea tangerina TaxID=430798 RepID=A0ABW4ZEG2_9BACT
MKTSLRSFLALTLLCSYSHASSLAEVTREYQAADRELNAQYQKARKLLPEYTFSEIQKTQREWLSHKLAEEKRLNGKIPQEELLERMTMLTHQRANYLRIRSSVKPNPKNKWDGTYEDGFGGTMAIFTQDDGSLYFEIFVVRGPTAHTGQVQGKATTNQDAARFTDKGTLEDKKDITWLDFRKGYQSSTMEVSGTNTTYYHGARAYFGGTYYRTGPFAPIIDGECEH